MDGLEKLALVFPHLGVIYLLHQLCVFVDEPCFPEYIGGCVLHLRSENADDRRVTVAAGGAENRTTASLIALHMYICTKDTFLFSMGALLKQKKKTPNGESATVTHSFAKLRVHHEVVDVFLSLGQFQLPSHHCNHQSSAAGSLWDEEEPQSTTCPGMKNGAINYACATSP